MATPSRDFDPGIHQTLFGDAGDSDNCALYVTIQAYVSGNDESLNHLNIAVLTTLIHQ